jgi:hypothetical protein
MSNVQNIARESRLWIPIQNKMLYICFLVFWASMACACIQPCSGGEITPRVTTVVRADRKTGRLIRSIAVNPKVALPRPVKPGAAAQSGGGSRTALHQIVEEKAKSYDVDPLLVHSVIRVESNYNPYALSSKGAEGIMQLIPATARRFGVQNPFNPAENIDAGVRYLKYLQTIFGDDRLALAAYNAGEGAVARYGWIPPYPETRNYVNQVSKEYGEARQAAASGHPAPSTTAEPPAADTHPKLEQYLDERGRVCFRTR